MKFEDVFIPLVTFSAFFVGYWFIWIEKEFNIIKKIGATIGLTAIIVLYFGMCYLIGKADQSQLYKPPEEKRDAKDMRSDYIAMFDGVIE